MGEQKHPYSSPEEMAEKTGITVDEARGVMKSWSYKQPEDLQEQQDHAWRATHYEHGMRGLNFDRRTGRITEKEYQQKADELADKYGQ